MLPITLTLAAAAALLNVWLAVRIVPLRYRAKAEHGDGGSRPLQIRIRAHANFTEYTPFVVILVGLLEITRGTQTWLWAVAMLYLVGRILHPLGMQRTAPNIFRAAGMLITWGVLLLLAGVALWMVYTTPPLPRG